MLYTLLLSLHNLTRWIIVITALWALYRVWSGLLSRRAWAQGDRMAGIAFTSALNVQFLIGVALYFLSPLTRPAFTTSGYILSSDVIRFFTLEHPVQMLLAVVIAQAGFSMSKRSTTDRARFMRAVIGYTIAVVVILAAIPWPGSEQGRPLLRLPF